jgi:hypothetical protein
VGMRRKGKNILPAVIIAGILGTGFISCTRESQKGSDDYYSSPDPGGTVIENSPANDTGSDHSSLEKASSDAEFHNYRSEMDLKLDSNKDTLTRISSNLNKLGKEKSRELSVKVKNLNNRNDVLRSKLHSYQYSSDENWNKFKSELDSEVKILGSDINGLIKESGAYNE